MDPIDSWVDAAEVRRLAETLLMPVRDELRTVQEPCFGAEFVGFAGPDLRSSGSRPTAAMAPPPAGGSSDPVFLRQLQETARHSLAGARQRAESGGLLERPVVAAAGVDAAPPENPLRTSPQDEVSAPPPPPVAATPASAPAPSVPVTVPADAPPEASRPELPRPPAPDPDRPPAPFVERLHAYGSWLRTAVQARAFFVTDRDGQVLVDEVRSPKLLQVARTLAQASHAANRQAGGRAVGSLHVKLGDASILEVLPVETDYGPLVLGIVVPAVLSEGAIPVIARGLGQVVDGRPA